MNSLKRTLKNGDKFYNYAKKSIITVELQPCRLCNSSAIIVIEDMEDEEGVDVLNDMFVGRGHVECTNPNCNAWTRYYHTDTNWSLNLGIEKAQNDWNNGIYAD